MIYMIAQRKKIVASDFLNIGRQITENISGDQWENRFD